MGGTQINLQIPNGTTRGLSATTVIVSEKEAENFTGMEGIDTETAEAGTIAMTDEDGNALTASDADGNAVECGVTDLGNGMESVTYGTVTEDPVNFSVADTLNTIVPKLVPLMLTLLLFTTCSLSTAGPRPRAFCCSSSWASWALARLVSGRASGKALA